MMSLKFALCVFLATLILNVVESAASRSSQRFRDKFVNEVKEDSSGHNVTAEGHRKGKCNHDLLLCNCIDYVVKFVILMYRTAGIFFAFSSFFFQKKNICLTVLTLSNTKNNFYTHFFPKRMTYRYFSKF